MMVGMTLDQDWQNDLDLCCFHFVFLWIFFQIGCLYSLNFTIPKLLGGTLTVVLTQNQSSRNSALSVVMTIGGPLHRYCNRISRSKLHLFVEKPLEFVHDDSLIHLQSVYMFGIMVGAIGSGILSDK